MGLNTYYTKEKLYGTISWGNEPFLEWGRNATPPVLVDLLYRVNVIVVIFHVCESSCMSKRQGIYSVIVCRLLSLLLCMALVTSGVLVTSASNCSMRTLTEQVGKCWKMVVKCLVMDISTHYKRVLVEKPGQCFFRNLNVVQLTLFSNQLLDFMEWFKFIVFLTIFYVLK